MVSLQRTGWIVLACSSLFACHDPIDPCAREHACEVPGIDLEIAKIEIVGSARDATTGLGVVSPDSIRIAYVIRNRGDSVAPPAALVLRYGWPEKIAPNVLPVYFPADTIITPALRPGETLADTIPMNGLETPGRPRHGHWFNDTSLAEGHLLVSDADSTNDLRVSAKVHVRVPVLEFVLTLPDTLLRIDVPFRARLTVNNTSRHAQLPPASVGFKLLRLPSTFIGGPNGFGTHDIAPILPSSAYQDEMDLTITSRGAWSYSVESYLMQILIGPPGVRDSLLYRSAYWLMDEPVRVTVRPNYASCQPAILAPDSTAWAPLVCTNPGRVYVFQLNARSDREYSIEQQDNAGATIYNPDGTEPLSILPGWWVHFHSAGTYYIVDYIERNPPPTRSMLLRERALTHVDNGGANANAASDIELLRAHRSVGVQRRF